MKHINSCVLILLFQVPLQPAFFCDKVCFLKEKGLKTVINPPSPLCCHIHSAHFEYGNTIKVDSNLERK